MSSVSLIALLLGSASSFIGIIIAGRSLLVTWRARIIEEAESTKRLQNLEIRVSVLEQKAGIK